MGRGELHRYGHSLRLRLIVVVPPGPAIRQACVMVDLQTPLFCCAQDALYFSIFLISAVIWPLVNFPFVSSFELGCQPTLVVVC